MAADSASPDTHRLPRPQASYLTEHRLELEIWIRRYAASLADLYLGALHLVYGPPIPGRAVLISHAVREICNRLPGRVSGAEAEARLDYVSRLDVLAAQWEHAGFDLRGAISHQGHAMSPDAGPGLSPDVAVPTPLFGRIAELVRDHVRARERPLEVAKRLFSAAIPEGGPTAAPVIDQWLKTKDWFMNQVHDPGRDGPEVDEAELRVKFELFEQMLLAVARPFYATLDELDAVLERVNA